MSDTSKTFRVFVSSTFNDLKAERNALQAFVFPRLRELCEGHQARFQPIDLRWGVSNEASLDQQAMQICLDEIERCKDISPRPNFIVLMGDRYGWLPPRAKIPRAEFEAIINVVSSTERDLLQSWYQLDENAIPPEYRLKAREAGGEFEPYQKWMAVEAQLHQILAGAVEALPMTEAAKAPYQASATHQEVIAGALTQTGAREHVFCFIRNVQGLPQSFDLNAFRILLAQRLARNYPQGLNTSGQSILDGIQALGSETSAKDLYDHLSALAPMPEQADLVRFIQQALVDFLGMNYVNYDETSWQIDRAAHRRLKALKEQLESEFGQHLFKAEDIKWQGDGIPVRADAYRCISEDHIGSLPTQLERCLPILESGYQPQNLCEATFQHLGRVILAELEKSTGGFVPQPAFPHFRTDEALDPEGLAHLAFAEDRIQNFVGREALLTDIDTYLRSDNERLLVIAGEGGSGKSALMAKALEKAQAAFPGRQILARFIGATPGSSDGRMLLESLCREIARRYGEDESAIPATFQELSTEFGKMLALASREKPMVLFLDSLDQLSPHQDVRELNWLPYAPPENVAIVLSTRDNEDTYANIEAKNPHTRSLPGLGDLDGEKLLNLWLEDARRTLQEVQRREVLEKFHRSGGNPLYLKLAFEEARLWTSYSPPESLAVSVGDIIQQNMLDRLASEGNHGITLVSHALGYLAASRFGLAEDELVDLLSRDPDVYEWFFNQTYHLPSDLVALAINHLEKHPELARQITRESHLEGERLAMAWLKQSQMPPKPVRAFIREVIALENGPRLPIVLWSRLSFDLAPYLTTRQVDDSALMTFYHRELGDVSREVFLDEDKAAAYHAKLARYFQTKADPQGDRSWLGTSAHALSELPYHLTEAGLRDDLFQTLTDFTYLTQKAERVGISVRVEEDGLRKIQSDGVHQLEQDFTHAMNQLYGGDGGAAKKPPIIVTALETSDSVIIHCPVCNTNSYISGALIGGIATCPNDDCQARLKINSFVIEAKYA